MARSCAADDVAQMRQLLEDNSRARRELRREIIKIRDQARRDAGRGGGQIQARVARWSRRRQLALLDEARRREPEVDPITPLSLFTINELALLRLCEAWQLRALLLFIEDTPGAKNYRDASRIRGTDSLRLMEGRSRRRA
jgi:hypothetical protein